VWASPSVVITGVIILFVIGLLSLLQLEDPVTYNCSSVSACQLHFCDGVCNLVIIFVITKLSS
jgi:hypothetical protein